MATSKSKRTVNLKLRQCEFKNLNFQPEKAGDELVERADLSLVFVVKDMEIDELLSAKANPLQLLWHKDKTVMFRDVKTIPVAFEAIGTLSIGISDEQLIDFDNAKLKKLSITPHVELQAEVKCQVRVDPTGNLEELGQMRVTEDCVMKFAGSEAEDDDKQEGLDV